jgi:hypothetical protein
MGGNRSLTVEAVGLLGSGDPGHTEARDLSPGMPFFGPTGVRQNPP